MKKTSPLKSSYFYTENLLKKQTKKRPVFLSVIMNYLNIKELNFLGGLK
jgi:hypothetical protein